MPLYVVVDVAGPVGAYASAEAARESLRPYFDAHWRGAIFTWDGEGPATGETAYAVMPSPDTGGVVPLFVGGLAEAAEFQARLAPCGLCEPAEDLEFRAMRVGSIIPRRERQLRQMAAPLRTEAAGGELPGEPADEGEKATEEFLQLMEKDTFRQAERLLPDEGCLPLCALMVPQPFDDEHCPDTPADSAAASDSDRGPSASASSSAVESDACGLDSPAASEDEFGEPDEADELDDEADELDDEADEPGGDATDRPSEGASGPGAEKADTS